MEWGFIWLMFGLKIPIVALLWLVWWAVHATPETAAEGGDDGGIGDRHPRRPLPHGPRRRGPHGDPATRAPARTRMRARSTTPASRHGR